MTGTSVPDLVDWTARATTIEQFGAFRYDTATLTGHDAPVRVSLVRVTAGMFTLWGISPEKGRAFRRRTVDRCGTCGATQSPVWQEEFSSDPSVCRNERVARRHPSHDRGRAPSRDPRRASSLTPSCSSRSRSTLHVTARDDRRLFVTARIKPGVSRAQAETDLVAIAGRLEAEYPNRMRRPGSSSGPSSNRSAVKFQTLLILLALVAALVAAMACANVSNVVLAQAMGRQRELSVRIALGARRSHHLKQVAVESLLISLAAGGIGLVLGGWGLALLKWLAGPKRASSSTPQSIGESSRRASPLRSSCHSASR